MASPALSVVAVGLQLRDGKLRPLLVERRTVHAMFATQLWHSHAALGLTKDRKDLWVAISARLHAKSPHAGCRENSTREAP